MPLRVMTQNLLYGSASRPADDDEPGTWPQRRGVVRRMIEEQRPDIVGFQEVEKQQLADLCEDLNDYECIAGVRNGQDRMPVWARWFSPPLAAAGAWFWFQNDEKHRTAYRAAAAALGIAAATPVVMTLILRRFKGRALEEGGYCPIFFRRDQFRALEKNTFWVSHVPHKPESVMPGTWLPRIVNWVCLERLDVARDAPDRRLTVFNAHLDWWTLSCHRSGRIVAEQMNRLWDGSPQIIMGDFNAPCESATYVSLMENVDTDGVPPLLDAYEQSARREGPEDTYHGGDGEGGWPGRIDHILFRPTMSVERVATLTTHEGDRYPSDHFPVVAELSIV